VLSNLTSGRIAAGHGGLNRIRQVAPICTPLTSTPYIPVFLPCWVYRPGTRPGIGRQPAWFWKSILNHFFSSLCGSKCVFIANFMAICRTIAKLWWFNGFSKWRPSAILDMLCACLDHPRRVFGGIYHCAKFGCSRCNAFEVLIFNVFGLRMPIHAPNGFFLGFHP